MATARRAAAPNREGSAGPDVDRLRAWSYGRQHLGHAADHGREALTDLVAVYSAHPSAPVALWARTRALTAAGFAELEAQRAAVRIVGMRGSAFLVPIAYADRIVSATRLPLRPSYLRGRGLDEGTYAALKPRLLDALREPLTPTELRRALAADGDQRPYFAMRAMAREGLVIRIGTGAVRTDDLRWAATEAWLGRSLGDADPTEAMAWLASAYLGAYGPSRVDDFAWWAGVSHAKARQAIASVDTLDVGAGLLLPAEQKATWARVRPLDPDRIDIVPKWDSYAMAYAPDGRRRLVDDAHLALAYSTGETKVGATSGDGLPLVLSGGRAVATWSHRLDGRRMQVTLSPFEAVGRAAARLRDAVRPGFDRLGEFLSAEVKVDLARA